MRKIQDLFTAEDAEVQSEDPFLFYCFFLCVALRPCGEKIFCRLSFRFEVTVQDRDYLGGKIMADKFEAKLLGVLGGMGPMAGAVFMERLTAMTEGPVGARLACEPHRAPSGILHRFARIASSRLEKKQ